MPCLTLSATHASLRSGATASAFITATLNPCRVRMSSIRSVMSRVPCGWRRPAPCAPPSAPPPPGPPGPSPWGRASPPDSGGTCTMTLPVLGSKTVSPWCSRRGRPGASGGTSPAAALSPLAKASASASLSFLEHVVVGPALGVARRVLLRVHRGQQNLLLVVRQARGHVGESEEHGVAYQVEQRRGSEARPLPHHLAVLSAPAVAPSSTESSSGLPMVCSSKPYR